MSVAVLRFPGSLDHESAARAIRTAGGTAAEVWHDEPGLPGGARAVVIPGGFSWGDHLRPGAIASRSRVMEDVRRHAERGGMVLGICNGFQVLCEAGLLPGALRPNATLSFVCRQTTLEVTDPDAPWTRALGAGARLSIPIKNNSGAWFGDPAAARVALRYVGEDALGSVDAAAGVLDEGGTVLGLMPHPEEACDPLLGSADGLALFRAAVAA